MADDLHYVPGDFYRLDDRSGFKVRANKMRKEWTELIVARELFELRPAQDFVKGVIDDQTVPEPRPRPAVDPMVGPPQVTLVAPPGNPLLLETSGDVLLETAIPFLLEQSGSGSKNIFIGGTTYIYPPGAGSQ